MSIPGAWPASRSQTPDIVQTPQSSAPSTPLSDLVFASSPTSSNLSARHPRVADISHEYSRSSADTELDESRLLPIGTPSPTPSPSPSPMSRKGCYIPRRQAASGQSSRPRVASLPLPRSTTRLLDTDDAYTMTTDASWTLSSTSSIRHSFPAVPYETPAESTSATYLLHLELPKNPHADSAPSNDEAPSTENLRTNALQFATDMMSTWNSEHSGSRFMPRIPTEAFVDDPSYYEDLHIPKPSSPTSPRSKRVLVKIRRFSSKMKNVFTSQKSPEIGCPVVPPDGDCTAAVTHIVDRRVSDQAPVVYSRSCSRRRPSLTPETYTPVLDTSGPTSPVFSDAMSTPLLTNSPSRSQETIERQIQAYLKPKTLAEIKNDKRRFSFNALSNITNRVFSGPSSSANTAAQSKRPRSSSALLLPPVQVKHRQDHENTRGRRDTRAIPSQTLHSSSIIQKRHSQQHERYRQIDSIPSPLERNNQRSSLPPLSQFASGLTQRGSWADYRND
ncbi:hypothetical protein VKT23_005571 [Stygiomarasmius scandens]|uniref:Uncharacterized protein n=1 Tax=Marasmiellus scandens TaxID=2682957 RepID=A0ABR1JQQ5_9AGAR